MLERILIVEDEMLLAMDLEAIIEDSGHRVLGEAVNLEEVEALPADIHPHLAFVDLHLAHGADGFDVCLAIQRRWPAALIAFVTANLSKIPPDFCGAHGVIAKPFSQAGIVGAIRYLADGVFDPPPHLPLPLPLPPSFTPSPALYRRWALA